MRNATSLNDPASNAGSSGTRSRAYCGERQAGLPHLAQPLGPEPGQRGETREREERLVRRDVRRRLLAADVLLAGLEREDERTAPVGVERLADDAPGHPPHVVRARGEEAVVRPAVRRPVARRLALPDRERAAVGARRLEHAEGHEVDVRDRQGTCLVRGRRQRRRVLQAAEEVRLLEEHGGRVDRSGAELVRVGDAVALRHLDDLEAEAGRVGLHDLAHLRIERFGQNDLATIGHMAGDEAGIGGDGGPVVAGRVGDVHPGQLADHGLVLEDRLQRPLAHLRLVRRVRGQELAPREDDVRDRRDVVVVDPRADEGELRARVDVLGGELLEVAHELGLAERRTARRARARSGRRAGSARRARRSKRRRSQRASPRGRRRSG